MKTDSTSFVYVTTKDKAQAVSIGRALVEARLAACVNILDGMESIYRWQGAIESARETVLLVKTVERLVPEVTAEIKRLHSYEVPCVVALPTQGGNPAYYAWIEGEVK